MGKSQASQARRTKKVRLTIDIKHECGYASQWRNGRVE